MWFRSPDNYLVRSSPGFTLLEILVTTALSLLLLGGSMAAYSSFAGRQTKVESARDVIGVLSLAQSRSRDGNKPGDDCTRLDGYRVWSVESTQQYYMAIRCDSNATDLETESYTLQSGEIFLQSFDVVFPPLPGPVQGAPVTIRIGQLESPDTYYEFSVNGQGVIDAGGMVEE